MLRSTTGIFHHDGSASPLPNNQTHPQSSTTIARSFGDLISAVADGCVDKLFCEDRQRILHPCALNAAPPISQPWKRSTIRKPQRLHQLNIKNSKASSIQWKSKAHLICPTSPAIENPCTAAGFCPTPHQVRTPDHSQAYHCVASQWQPLSPMDLLQPASIQM